MYAIRSYYEMNRSTWNIDRDLTFYEANPESLICPRGAAGQIYRICQNAGEHIQFIDERRTLDTVAFDFKVDLRPLQAPAVKNVLKNDFGLLAAGTGAGKTVMGLYLIAESYNFV